MPGLALGMFLVCVCLGHSAVAQESEKVTFSADNTRWYADDKVTATGNVKATYKDLTVTADKAEADLKTNIAVFNGNVKLTTKQTEVEGQDLTLNLKTRAWSLAKAKSRVMASMQTPLPGQPATGGSPLYITSTALTGNPNEVIVTDGTLTTCDLEHPHYYFSARELEIYPDVKVVAHSVSLMALDRRLISLRTLVVPIRGLRQNLIPQVGTSADEGSFIKAAYAYTATSTSQGTLKLDLMSKKGIGVGLDHTLTTKLASTQASVYLLSDKQIGGTNITGYLRHQQKIGTIDLNLTGNYRTNSYLYYPSSTNQDWQAALSQVTARSNTALTYRTSKTAGFGTSSTDNTTLRHTRQFSKRLTGSMNLDMRQYLSTGMSAADRELNTDIQFAQRENKYDLTLAASKRFDLDGAAFAGDNNYGSLDRLPEITWGTDSYRLGAKAFFGLPSRVQVVAGRYHERPNDVTGNRYLMQWDLLGKNIDLGTSSELNITAGFRQAYYASDMMQYSLKAGTMLTTRYGDYLKSRISYYYQRPEGFSPFRFDYTGKYNYSRAVLDYQRERKLKWSISSGYNFNQTAYPWQDVSLRLTAHPTAAYSFAVSTGYDLNRSKWRTLVGQFRLMRANDVALDLGTRYDLEQGKIGLARARFDIPIGKKWRIEGITSWNGSSKQWDYRAFRLTRDLHCWEASLIYNEETGFRNVKGISLEFKIKAFQTQDRFGIGQYGQAVDTGMGDYY